METWIQITTSDVADYLAAPQLEALQSKALASGQTDPLPRLIADITAQIRARLASAKGVQLASGEALLPPELKGAAIALIIEALQTRLPSLELSSDQIRRADNARKLIDHAANSRLALTMPETAADAGLRQGGSSVTVTHARSRRATSNNLNQL